MDFKPMKKDGKPNAEGLFGGESPRLKAELAKARAKPEPTAGLTPAT